MCDSSETHTDTERERQYRHTFALETLDRKIARARMARRGNRGGASNGNKGGLGAKGKKGKRGRGRGKTTEKKERRICVRERMRMRSCFILFWTFCIDVDVSSRDTEAVEVTKHT